jgi:GTP cyclohydrolase I
MERTGWEQFNTAATILARRIPSDKYTSLYPIPRGGVPVAMALQSRLGIPIVDKPNRKTLIVDDIADSGETLLKYADYDTATLFVKPHSKVLPTYFVASTSKWISFPWEEQESPAETHIQRILESIGENPNRVGLADTPRRVAKMYRETFKGYNPTMKPNITVFPNNEDGVSINQMVTDSGTYVSWCEHHMLPFFGHYYFAYIPKEKIIGLSKIARVVDYFASRLQVQERLTAQIVNEIHDALDPVGMALQMRGRHLCKEIRGIKNKGEMVTTELRGAFEQQEVRMEFLHIIGRQNGV